MGLFSFENWFGKSSEKPQPKVGFGRFSDRYKAAEQYEAWYRCLDRFEEGDHFGAYEDFFKYLSSPEEENVHYERSGDEHFSFELYQGSQCIKGYSDGRKFRAEAKVVQVHELHLGFMRRLLEKNFTLRYSRFSLDEEDDIAIIFDTFLLDGSPQKLYHALNELAIQADKMDDLLEQEFDGLERIRYAHIQPLSDSYKEIKYQFFKDSIYQALELVEKGALAENTYPLAISYVLLDAIYKIDYLTKPEGYVMDVFERINRNYFNKDAQRIVQKNRMFQKELKALVEQDPAVLFEGMYDTVSTFGVTQVVGHTRLVDFITEVMKEYDWYDENGHKEYCLAITGYIVGYSLFYWALPRPDKELLHLYYEILYGEYFRQLGFSNFYYDEKKKRFNKYAIRRAVNEIIRNNRSDFDALSIDTTILEFDDHEQLASTYLLMIRAMVLEEK